MRNLIDRQAAIDAICDAILDPVSGMQAIEAVLGLPGEEEPKAERPRGRWVIHSDEAGYDVNCSECGDGYASIRKWNPVAEEYERPSLSQYCPHCGAYMENAE